jgi:hypothetical protein
MQSAILFEPLLAPVLSGYRVTRSTPSARDHHLLHAKEQEEAIQDDSCRPKDISLLLLLLRNLSERLRRPGSTAGH